MRTLQTHIVDGTARTISPDEPLQPPQMAQWLLRAQLRDEVTGLPPDTPLHAACSDPRLTPRIVEGGLAGLAGYPNRAPGTPVRFSIEGPRILPFAVDALLPVNLGPVDLHRTSVTLMGRTARRLPNGSLSPVNPAAITITEIWRVRPPAGQAADSPMPALFSLRPGVYAPRSTAGSARSITLTPVAGDLRQLTEARAAGDIRLRVSNSNVIAPGDILALEPGDPFKAEYIVIHAIYAPADPNAEAVVELEYPCRYAHRRGAAAPQANTSAPGPTGPLTATLVVGEECIVAGTTATTSLAGVVFAEIELGGPPIPEYQRVFPFVTASNAEGYFQFPPLSRAGQITLRANDGATDIDRTVTIDYRQPFQTVNFIWN